MRRFGLRAALGLGPARAGALRDRIEQRRAERAGAGEEDADGAAGLTAAARGAVSLPPGVTLASDVAYGSDPAQRLDVYRPAGAQRAPVIVFVHGGGWRRGDKAMPRMVGRKAPYYTARGCVFVSANHRLLPAADVIEQAGDVGRAVAFVQAEAAAWGGDPARVVVIGHSAGAHLAALITADGSLAARHGAEPWLGTVALDSAALDMVAIMSRPHYRFYDPVFGTDPDFWRDASPTHRLQARPVAPMLLVCSSNRDDSCPPAREFAAKATALGGRVTVLPVALSHFEINDQLGAPGAYTDAVGAFLRTLGLP